MTCRGVNEERAAAFHTNRLENRILVLKEQSCPKSDSSTLFLCDAHMMVITTTFQLSEA
jgi:hypothetical protein